MESSKASKTVMPKTSFETLQEWGANVKRELNKFAGFDRAIQEHHLKDWNRNIYIPVKK
jgi:hypothetical protein